YPSFTARKSQRSMNPNEPNGPKLRVAVLMGGASAERAVSLSTGRMILNTLDPQKYLVTAIDTQDIIALPASGSNLLPSPPIFLSEEQAGQAQGFQSLSGPQNPPARVSNPPSPTAWEREPGIGVAAGGDLLQVGAFDKQRPDVVFIA